MLLKISRASTFEEQREEKKREREREREREKEKEKGRELLQSQLLLTYGREIRPKEWNMTLLRYLREAKFPASRPWNGVSSTFRKFFHCRSSKISPGPVEASAGSHVFFWITARKS